MGIIIVIIIKFKDISFKLITKSSKIYRAGGIAPIKNSESCIMYVCICHDVKDTQIKTALTQGVRGMEGLQECLSVGTCCGCCVPMVQDLIDEHQENFVAIDVMAG